MVDELIQKIADESELDEDDVREKINEKEEEFSGLVSEEGAAHLVAREHGVTIEKDVDKDLKIESVVPDMNRVNLKAKVINITDLNTFERDDGEEGQVQNLVLGDETGTLRMSLWDDQVDVADKIDEGDNIEVANAYSKEDNRGNPELRIGDSTKIKRIGDDEVGDVKQSSSGDSSGSGYERTRIDDITTKEGNYEISGEVLQIYTKNPFYQTCPECGETLKKDDDYECPEHGDVDPEYNLALSAVVDDGFGNIRCVFFRDDAKELLDAEDEEFQGNSRKVQDHAKKVVGTRVAVKGRSQRNDFFDAMELIVNEVEKPSIQHEITTKIEAIQDE
ncbi:MAG: DUF2240 family protein [Candidatus Nanohaloarchaea archaeon]|nr:DUF2240 family protein [Candidatus Nanohaloarchaea archaeon]